MTPKEIYKFIIEQSPEPLIKNPVLRKVVDQERLGFYLGKSVPSKGTIEDADTKKAEDALSGVNEVMKVADLQRQGHIGHFYADGGRIGFKNGKNVFLKQGKKSRFTSGAETTVINGKEYLRITKKGDPNFGKYVYRTSIATPGYGRSGKSKNEYLTRDELVKRVSAPKTGKASYIPKKEYTQSLENIKTYVKSQGGPSKVFLSDLVEMFGDSTTTGRDMKTEQRIEKALGDDYKKLISGGERKKTTQTNKIKFNKLVRDVNRGDKPLINLTQSKTNIAPNQLKQLLNPTELKMYEKLSPKFKAVLSRVIQPRQRYSLDDVKNISETTTKTFNKMTKNYPLSIVARTDIFKSGTRFFNNKSYILGQIARHVSEGGNLYRHVSGNKMSDVKFRNNKTGKLITYRNIDITDPEFKEAATIYDEWDTVKNTKINNPLKSGEKITIAKAMASGGDNLVIDHLDVDGVKGNPLKNLAITNQKANMAGQIIGLTQAEADAIGRGKKFSVEDNIKRYSSYGDKLLKQSAGDYNFKKLTPSETIIKKTGTLKGKEISTPLRKKLMTFCPRAKKGAGGEAVSCTIDEAMDGLIKESEQFKSGTMKEAQARKTAQKIRAVTRVGTGSTLTGLLGPYGLAGEVVIDGSIMANNMLDGGDTYKEALSKSLIKYAMPTDARKKLEKETDRDTMILGSDTQGLAGDYVSAKQKYDDLINKYENLQQIKKDETFDPDTLVSTYSPKDEIKAKKEFERSQIRAEPLYGKNIFDVLKFGSPEQEAYAAKEEVFDAKKMQNKIDRDRKILGSLKDLFGTGFYSPEQLKRLQKKADRESLAIGQRSYEDKMQEVADYGGVANLAGGGIASLPGVRQGPAPLSGPLPDGLPFVPNRVTKI